MSEFLLSDALLEQAAVEVRDALLDSLPPDDECTHEFSPAFKAKMDRLIRVQNRRSAWKKALKTAAAVVLVLLITSGVYLISDSEARADFVEWVRTTYENSIFYQFFTPKDKKFVLGECEFGWLPDGCAVEQTTYGEDSNVVLLSDPDVGLSTLIYMAASSETKLEIEGPMPAESREVSVNGMPAQLYKLKLSGVPDRNVLVWFGDGGRVIFNLSAEYDADTLLRIAEGITLK